MEPQTTPKTAAARLTDIEVDEVSMVDKAANKRKYLVVKNASGAPAADAPAVDPPASTPATPPVGEPPAPAPVPAGEPGGATPSPPAPAEPPPVAPAATASTPAPTGDSPAPPPTETPVEKRGAKMAKARLARFKAAHQQLGELITELETATAEMADAVDALEDDATDTTKRAVPAESTAVTKMATLESRVAELEGKLTSAQEKIAKQADLISKARFGAVGNSREPDGDGGAPAPSKVIWPRDLNEERKPRRAPAAR